MISVVDTVTPPSTEQTQLKNYNCQVTDIQEFHLEQSLQLFDFHTPLPKKLQGTLRLFYNNCNGIEINHVVGEVLRQKRDKVKHNYLRDIEAPTKLDSIIRQMKVWEVDMVNLSELCVDWNKYVPRTIIQQITQKYDKTGSWTVSTSNIDMDNFLKPGGTGILSMGVSNGRVKARGVDPWKMGRWSYTLLSGVKAGSTLLIVTGYRPGHRTGTPGAKTAWSQQQAMLLQEKRSETPTEAFLIDLSKWLHDYRTPSMEILIMLDANEQWTYNASIARFADRFDLCNINNEFSLPATHPHIANSTRSTTIDFCLGTARVLENIQYASSTPFDLEVLGDHRGVIIDLNINRIIGEIPREEDIKLRKLVMSSPKAVEKYLDIVEQKFRQQNIFHRSQKLIKRVADGHTDYANIMRHYEALDKEVFGICTKAEKKCRPSWAGKFEWSPKLARAIKELQYWRSRLRRDNTVLTKKLGIELQIDFVQSSTSEIQQNIQEVRQRLTEIQHNARKHRQDHLDLVAQQYADQNHLSKQQAILELMSHEESRNTFSILRRKLKPHYGGRLKTLWAAVDEEGNFIKDHGRKEIYTDPSSIHQKLLQRNADHLGQASDTPFAKGWLRKKLKWDGTGPLADDILTGDILHQRRFNASMQLYLECLRMDTLSRMNIVRPNLTLDEYRLFWKKKRETTVTSPYGLHVGHYKAALHKLAILNVHRILLLIPFQTGMVPSRWRRTVQTMLEKEPGSPWIHRLRIIELFDAQANAGFQIFVGRNMMKYAVQHGLLQEESFGSTPGKMATAAVVQKLMAVDQLRIERRAGGIFDCDASGCYDRILPPLASVHMRALGLHKSIGVFLARLMFQAKRHVRTGYGVSEQTIRTTKQRILHGIGQGNGGGPAMWISQLTIMFAAISSVCVGFALTCVQNLLYVTTVGTGYVDDVTLGLSIPRDQPQTESQVLKQIKRMGQLWENLLFITGGRLELSKCFWIPITWKWTGGIPKIILKNRRCRPLKLRESESHELIHIPRKSAKEFEKRLGVWSSCTGKWNKEVNLWIIYSQEFCQKLRGAGMHRNVGFLAYHSVWLARFRYSAAVIGYSTNQLSAIQSAITGTCLSIAGYNRKFPRAVVFGPKEYGGLGWEDINLLNLYEKLKLFIGSIRLQDKLGAMILIQLTWLQLIAGISTPILQYNRYISYLPVGWITNIHHQLVTAGVQVEIASGWLPTTQRINDIVLMDIVHRQLPPWVWEGINRCRLYLQATTLADLVTADGKYIPTRIIQVKGRIRESTLSFPVQRRPSNDDIAQWQYFLNSIAHHGHLFTPLEHWCRTPDQKFKYMIDIVKRTVYKRSQVLWEVFRRQSGNSRRYIKLRFLVDTLPPDSTPVRVIESAKYLLVLQDDLPTSVVKSQTSIYHDRQHQAEKNVMGKYDVDEILLEELQQKWHRRGCEIICATDGGLKIPVGTSSYAIYFPGHLQPILSGRAGEYQPSATASSTRQELLGQLGIEYWLDRLEREWGRPRYGIQATLVTDSQVSLDIMENIPHIMGIKDTLRAEMDIALELFNQRSQHRWVSWNMTKVESHIDVLEAPDEFMWEYNKYVDELATRARTEFSLSELKLQGSSLLSGARAGCVIDGRIENNTLLESLRKHINGKVLRNFLMEKYHWTETTFSQIDWRAHNYAIRQFPRHQQITLFKYVHGWLATTKRRYRERAFPTNRCTLCGQEDGRMHLFHCQNEQFQGMRGHLWRKLVQDITQHTESDFTAIFLLGMQVSVGADQPQESVVQTWPNSHREAFQAQTNIGWDNILFGRLATHWDQLAGYIPCPGSETRSGVWTNKAVKFLLQFGLDLWTTRNQLVHGTENGVSLLERQRVRHLISLMFQELKPSVECRVQVVFDRSEDEVHRSSVQCQLAWLGKLKYLFPEKYNEILTRRGVRYDWTVSPDELVRDASGL